jgi:hypothetical protein
MQRNNTSEQLLLWVPLGYQFPFTWVRFGFILIPTRPMLLSFLGLLFQLEFESPSSSYTSSQSKATTKLPGRTLIRPGTGPTRWVRLLRPSNPTRLGQAAAGPVLIGYGPEQALLKNLNIETTRYAANRAKEQYRIFIPKREVHKVQGLVKGRIPSMMAYRVGL